MSTENIFNYKEKSTVKLTDEFKQKFTVDIKDKKAIKLEGLTALAHQKGLWKFETEIVQFPNDSNNWTAICKTTLGGYDWDPINEKIREVEYSDIGDANVTNCTKMVASSFIRMASTRSQGRVLRKYTNVDMVCSSEIDAVTEDAPENKIGVQQLMVIRNLVKEKNITQEGFNSMMISMFGTINYMDLSEEQGNTFINVLSNYVAPDTNSDASDAQEHQNK